MVLMMVGPLDNSSDDSQVDLKVDLKVDLMDHYSVSMLVDSMALQMDAYLVYQ